MKPPYFLLEDGLPTGPHSLVVLQQKAEILVITPDSTVRPSVQPDAPWLPIRAIPDLYALLYPPRSTPTLGVAARFAVANPPPDTDANRPVEVERMLQQNTARLVATEHFAPSAVRDPRARRRRSFVFTVLAAALPCAALYRYGPLPKNEAVLIGLGSFVGIVALMSYWIIYHISDFRS